MAANLAEAGLRRRPWGPVFHDPALEQAFQADYADRFVATMRTASLVGFLLYATFGLLDGIVAPDTAPVFWSIRLGLAGPMLLLSYAATRSPTGRGRLQLVFTLVTLAFSAGILAMVAIGDRPVSEMYYAGLLLVVGFGCTVARLRFPYAALTGVVTVVGYDIVALTIGTPADVLWNNNFFLVAAVCIGLVSNYGMDWVQRREFVQRRIIEDDKRRLAELAASLEEASIRDHLTGLYNRRHLDTRLAELLKIRTRHGTQTTCLLLDLDGFKAVNDTHGHPAGDAALQAVARILLDGLMRESDLAFRYGGDEFCLLLPHTPLEGAERLIRDVRARLADVRVEGVAEPLPLDASTGCLALDARFRTPDDVLRALDHLLYEAKRQGKGTLVCAA
jgi:diguanylate cyclase (GGDEF)-like protein